MFEDDMASPTWRHTHVGDSRGPHADGARAVEFVVRTVATIGNYDYMFDVRCAGGGGVSFPLLCV